MKTLLGKFLCFIGFHDWEERGMKHGQYVVGCKRCKSTLS